MCEEKQEGEQKVYLQSYGDLGVHRLMLRDKVRVDAYWNAIFKSKHKIAGKTVLDVGAGTGILSVFCAQAGARKVYAVEASDVMIPIIRSVITDNNCGNTIEVIHGDIEKLELPEKADVLVSEWMGYYLLHEAMLDSIISARRFLKSDCLIIPDKATMFIALCDVPSLARDWSKLRTANLCSVTAEYRSGASHLPLVDRIIDDDLMSEPKVFATFDLYTVKTEDLEYLTIKTACVAKKDGILEGVCIWWEVELSGDVILSTSPACPRTHWKQTMLLFPGPVEVKTGTPFGLEFTLYKYTKKSYKLCLSILDPDGIQHDIPCSCYSRRCQLVKSLFNELSTSTNA